MEHKPDTLVILSPGFPASEADTACMPPQQLFVKALKEICPGLRIIVLTFHYPFSAAEYEWHGVKVIALGGKDDGRLFRLLTWFKAWITLGKINREHHVLGLLSFWFGECALIGNYFAKRHRLSHYSWLLGQDAKRGNKYFRWIKPRGDTLIALSDFLAREVIRNHGVVPANVIPVGIDISMFPQLPLKRDIDVLGAGSLIPLKQYHLFVEAIALLKPFYPDIKAVLCGKGPEMDNLKTLAESLNLNGNIVFNGEVPHTAVLDLMQRSKIFLHPSNYEGYGAVLAEALFGGAHVVSFCKPMRQDYRHHHVVKNKDEMFRELLAILKNRNRGHDRVAMCPAEQIAKNMISLYAE